MNPLYLKVKSKGTRNRDVRVKLELFLLIIRLGDASFAVSYKTLGF